MTRPTVVPPPGDVVDLTDEEVPDFLDAHPVAVLAFVDAGNAESARLRDRLALVVARLAPEAPGLGAGVVDAPRYPLVADALGVKAVPMTFVFTSGDVVDRLMGLPPAAVLEDVLRPRLPRG